MSNHHSVRLFMRNRTWGWGSAIVCVIAILALAAAMSVSAQDACTVTNTPYFTEYHGNIAIDGNGAPIGAVIEAFNTAGVRTGCFVVSFPGVYGYMRVYGADPATGTPGMSGNEPVTFKINGALAQTNPSPVLWADDQAQHQVHLTAASLPATVEDLAAEKVAGGVRLSWTHVGSGVDHYEVWRGEMPYFMPILAEAVLIAPSIAPPANIGDLIEFTDTTGHLGDPAIEDFYVVMVVGANGQTSLISNRAGAVDFSLQAGG